MTEPAASAPELEPESTFLRDVCLGITALLTVMGGVGTAFAPWFLVRMPLVLLVLSPDMRHLVLVAASTDYLPALAASVPRRMTGVLTMYGLGWYFGPVALQQIEDKVPQFAGAFRWVERLFARLGVLLLVVFPGYLVGAMAGIPRTPFPKVFAAALVGQVLYVTVIYFVGDWIQDWTAPLLQFLAEHLLESTAVCVALVVGQQAWSKLRGGDEESKAPVFDRREE